MVAFTDNFEAATGWIVSGNASDGQWQRAIPSAGADRGDPPADADGSGRCYVTDNGNDADVDGGTTVLTSPALNATGFNTSHAVLSYYRWYCNDAGAAPNEDILQIDISGNNGASWTPLDTRTGALAGLTTLYVKVIFAVANAPASQVRVGIDT